MSRKKTLVHFFVWALSSTSSVSTIISLGACILQIWAGNPAKFLRKLTEEEIAFIVQSAANYVNLAKVHAAENVKSFDEIQFEKMLRKKFARRDEEYDSMLGVVRETPPELVLPDNILPADNKSQKPFPWEENLDFCVITLSPLQNICLAQILIRGSFFLINKSWGLFWVDFFNHDAVKRAAMSVLLPLYLKCLVVMSLEIHIHFNRWWILLLEFMFLQ